MGGDWHDGDMAPYRNSTTRAAIAEYWLDTAEGRERLPENEARFDWGEPNCFACGFWGTTDDEPPDVWKAWNRARLDRCHLVPRTLGGDDQPANLVLLCSRCHRDAPNVADPTYMLRWIADRGSWVTRELSLIEGAIDRAGFRDVVASLSDEQLAAHRELFPELLRSWTATHGPYVTDSTIEAAIVESIVRLGYKVVPTIPAPPG
jgi:hypothetical protein